MRRLLPIAAALLVAGCATPFSRLDFAPGTPRDQVIAQAGKPSREVRSPTGDRLIYTLQPWGRQAWSVQLDGSGKVAGVRQVLTEENLERIQPGWTRQQVEDEFGPPAWMDRVASWDGEIMNYRWRDRAFIDMWYWVYLDVQGVVRRAHPGVEYPLPGGDAPAATSSKD